MNGNIVKVTDYNPFTKLLIVVSFLLIIVFSVSLVVGKDTLISSLMLCAGCAILLFLLIFGIRIYRIDIYHNRIKFPRFSANTNQIHTVAKATEKGTIALRKDNYSRFEMPTRFSDDSFEDYEIDVYTLYLSTDLGKKEFTFYDMGKRDKVYDALISQLGGASDAEK